MIEPLDALKDKIVMVAKVLQHQGVIDGYGHITARLPDKRILSTPHMPPGKVAVLLRGHGGTVVARNLDQLLRFGLDLVRSAKIQIMAAALGTVKTHSPEECQAMVRNESRPDVHRRFLDYYISEVVD